MKLRILGSGGATSIPRACCQCKECKTMRKSGEYHIPPSLYIEDEKILIDTPEGISFNVNKYNIKDIKHIIYTHWHPDHTQGLRIIEEIRSDRKVEVYIPKKAKDEFYLYTNFFEYFEKKGWMTLNYLEDNIPLKIGSITIFTAIWTILSFTVGIPNGRRLPSLLGIHTLLTAFGR